MAYLELPDAFLLRWRIKLSGGLDNNGSTTEIIMMNEDERHMGAQLHLLLVGVLREEPLDTERSRPKPRQQDRRDVWRAAENDNALAQELPTVGELMPRIVRAAPRHISVLFLMFFPSRSFSSVCAWRWMLWRGMEWCVAITHQPAENWPPDLRTCGRLLLGHCF